MVVPNLRRHLDISARAEHDRGAAVRVIEHLQGRYTSQEVPFGVVYAWSPKCVVTVCGECGTRMALTTSMTICSGCGVDYLEVVRRELGRTQTRAEDEDLHPWRYVGYREELGLPY